jgi:hypothetical protein
MSLFPSAPSGIQVELLPRWPGRISGTGGIKVTSEGGAAIVASDIASLGAVTPMDGSGRYVQVWNEANATNERVEMKNIWAHGQRWDDVIEKPALFPPEPHLHLSTDLSDATAVGRAVLTAVDEAAARLAIAAAETGHTHATADIADASAVGRDVLTAADAAAARAVLDTPAVAHVHLAADVADFVEAVADRVAALLVAGTGIQIDYDDAADRIVVSNAAVDGVLVSAGAIPANISAADFTLPAAARAYHLKLWGLATGTQASIDLRMSHDGGATFDTAGYAYVGADYDGSGHVPFSSISAGALPLIANAAARPSGRLVEIRISTASPTGTTMQGLLAASAVGSEPFDPVVSRLVWGVGPPKSAPLTTLRLVFSAPSRSGGVWALYKLQEGA